MFESHHIFTRKDIKGILSNYEIKGTPPKEIADSGVYDWDHTLKDPFTIELHARAKALLGQDIKANWPRIIEIMVLFIIALTQIVQFTQGYWHAIITMPLTWWAFGVNVFHDGSHFAFSKRWNINKLSMNCGFMFSTPYVWYHQHVIGHHSFPNVVGYDPDLYHAPDITRHSDDIKVEPQHKWQTLTFIWTWLLAVPVGLMLVGVIQAYKRANYNRVVPFARSKHLNPDSLYLRLAIFIFVFHVVPFYLFGFTIKGFISALVPIYMFSVCFMISSQINHLTPDNVGQFNKNFFKHQILTSHNVATSNYWVTLFTGGLNLQIEHHLFPSVNHCHLPKLAPLVQELSKKYNIHYNESPTLLRAVQVYLDHLRNYNG